MGISREIVEEKRKERERKLRERRRKNQLRAGIFFLVLVLLFVGLILFFRSSTFDLKLEKVTISGNKVLKDEEILKTLSLKPGTSIFALSVRNLALKLEENPWVKEVNISRRLPDGLSVKVVERRPLALLEANETGYLIDEEAFVIAQVDPEKVNLPSLHDIPIKSLKVGLIIDSEPLQAGLKVLSSMPQSLYKKIKLVSVPGGENITFYTDEGVEILFGRPEEIERKFEIIEKLLRTEKNVLMVDVRVPSNPVTKPTQQ